MQGKVCLITGGTNGIGKSAAQKLAGLGATVVIVGRDAHKASQVVEEIRLATGNPNVDSLLADLSSQQDVRRLASDFQRMYSRLHVLLNNAGGTFLTRQLSVDGLEMTFALNHLAYFLLTNLLLDMLKASAPARIINVSSDAHANGKIEFDNLQGERDFSGLGPYGNSKLANILFTLELARRLDGTGVTANALHPGLTSTGFGKNNPGWLMTIMGAIIPLIARAPEKGAQTSVYLASSPEVAGVTGKYFVDSKVARPAARAADGAVARQLWDVSADLTQPKWSKPR
ncbi:MAG: SDR family oxidoreductase [Anaerolineales bacterium]|nr:SDR family oxidoreductase [Anaerolineales bacterium]